MMECLLNIIWRGILGGIAIYFINLGLDYLGLSVGVGINPISLLTTGLLGFPGLVGLYVICLCKKL